MQRLLLFIFIATAIGCKESFDIPLRPSDQGLLVVEGVLNAGSGPTTILLSQSVNLKDASQSKPVLKAKLTVESTTGTTISLTELGNGKYSSPQLGLVSGQEYKLRIKTENGKEYLSDYVVAKQTPIIDSISWRRETDGLHIYANTHDQNNATRYYKWDYDETWEILSYYASLYQYIGGTTIIQRSSFYNNRCWKYASSTTINIGSSVQLQNDVINESPIQFIPQGAERLSVRYSILVKQQSLSMEAYNYYKLMKKNTETVGSLFDAQPSELKGNIHCITNPSEMVIGYITASTIQEKRIFITSQQANWKYNEFCDYERIRNHPDSLKNRLPNFLPWEVEIANSGAISHYLMSPASCVDCTKRGGNLNIPSYW